MIIAQAWPRGGGSSRADAGELYTRVRSKNDSAVPINIHYKYFNEFYEQIDRERKRPDLTGKGQHAACGVHMRGLPRFRFQPKKQYRNDTINYNIVIFIIYNKCSSNIAAVVGVLHVLLYAGRYRTVIYKYQSTHNIGIILYVPI